MGLSPELMVQTVVVVALVVTAALVVWKLTVLTQWTALAAPVAMPATVVMAPMGQMELPALIMALAVTVETPDTAALSA
jgi:hypothetical protein